MIPIRPHRHRTGRVVACLLACALVATGCRTSTRYIALGASSVVVGGAFTIAAGGSILDHPCEGNDVCTNVRYAVLVTGIVLFLAGVVALDRGITLRLHPHRAPIGR